jgi:hypothetical protein
MSADTSNEEHGLGSSARDEDARPDIDLTAKNPLRLGVAYGDTVWLNDAPGEVVRVRAEDLRALADRVGAVRHEHPGRDVVVDIDVVIAGEAREARAALAKAGIPPDHDTLRYVGTATGLAGLVTDLYALGITDGAMLILLLGEETLALIRDVVVPELASFMPDPVPQRHSRPA